MQNLSDLPSTDYAELHDRDPRDTTVITVNNRLSRRVIQSLAREQTIQGQRVSEIPAVVPWSGWIVQQLSRAGFQDELVEHTLLLDQFASQIVWAEAIETLEKERVLLDVTQAAAGAMQAAQLIDEWHIQVDVSVVTDEHASFLRWRDGYQSRLHALNALDPNLAVARLIQHIEAGLELPGNIVLAGFTEISPRMRVLCQALLARGIALTVLREPAAQVAALSRVVCGTAQSEWQTAAHWARAQLTEHPEGRFAIVAVSLDAQVPFARRMLSRVLSDSQGVPEYAFNVAVARPLADWEAGRAALAWLRTFVLMKEHQQAAPAELSAALLAGHCIGHIAEMGGRAQIDARWRQQYVGRVSLAGWTYALSRLEQLSPAWQRAWQDWQAGASSAQAYVWARFFRATLSTLGFPGVAQQSSPAYQVLEAFDALFERFESLSAVLGTLTAGKALKVLNRLARSTLFQPQRAPDTRLDVLGLLEAEGGQWDAVWMLGLTDEVLPAIAKPNPFIPAQALRQAQAPRATPERERQWAEKIFEALCYTAPTIVVSSALFEGERSLRPSPLIVSLEPSPDLWTPVMHEGVAPVLERLADDQGPSLVDGEKISGGIGLLETQARNPLWAFIKHRLGVSGLPPYTELAYKMQRGIFLHGVLQRIWEELHDQETLHDAVVRGTLAPQLVRIAQEVGRKELHAFEETLQQLEIERGVEVVRRWLALEEARLPFEVIEVEQKRKLSVKGLTLEVRLDRLDAVGEAKDEVIIDYKTGATLPKVLNDWRTPRPLNLQVPAYAMMLSQADSAQGQPQSKVSGLVLAQLHSKETVVTGLIERDCLGLKGAKTLVEAKFKDESWQALLLRLQAAIETLAAEFVTGHALNQAWNKTDLEHCDVLPLLRLYEEEPSDE
jgi:probable DNA repair protein